MLKGCDIRRWTYFFFKKGPIANKANLGPTLREHLTPLDHWFEIQTFQSL